MEHHHDFQQRPSCGGVSPEPVAHVIDNLSEGLISVDKQTATAGETVTITVLVDNKRMGPSSVLVGAKGSGSYGAILDWQEMPWQVGMTNTFVMPDADVNVIVM